MICFDIGNVICHVDFNPFFNEIMKHNLFKNHQEAESFILKNEKLDYLGISTITDSLKKSFPHLSDDLLNEFETAWNKCVWPNDQVMNFINKLRFQDTKIALLSNMGTTHATFLQKKYPEIFDVDVAHLSCDVGSFKPQKLFFQSFLLSHESFSGAMYLDDRMENVIAGSNMKFSSIHFDLYQLTHNQPPSVLQKELNQIQHKLNIGY
jgi:FMN phosphatase YigB (HAD superfamily)